VCYYNLFLKFVPGEMKGFKGPRGPGGEGNNKNDKEKLWDP
jgi:hypothetical protein